MGELGLFSCLLLCTLSEVLIFSVLGSWGSTTAGNVGDLLLFPGIVTTTSYKTCRLSLDFFHIINMFLGIRIMQSPIMQSGLCNHQDHAIIRIMRSHAIIRITCGVFQLRSYQGRYACSLTFSMHLSRFLRINPKEQFFFLPITVETYLLPLRSWWVFYTKVFKVVNKLERFSLNQWSIILGLFVWYTLGAVHLLALNVVCQVKDHSTRLCCTDSVHLHRCIIGKESQTDTCVHNVSNICSRNIKRMRTVTWGSPFVWKLSPNCNNSHSR